MAEQFALQHGFGKAAAMYGHKRPAPPRPVKMYGPGHQFLAGAAFPLYDSRHFRLGNPRDIVEDFTHPGAVADDIGERIFLLQFKPEPRVLGAEAGLLQHIIYGGTKFGVLKRLGHVVRSPEFHGLHG